jgi:hypothetical protein
MAPLPSNNTKVWFLDYVVCSEEHTLQARSGDSVDASEASADLDQLLSAITDEIFEMTITRLRVREQGSTVSLPATWSGGATYGDGAGVHGQSAQYGDFVGRSFEGRRVRLAIFGWKATISGVDFRVTSAEDSAIADAVALLNTTSDMFLAIDGTVPVWYDYANLGDNAYWRNRIR